MKDILLFIIGIISTLLIILFNIERFRNKEYNPKLFRLRHGSEWRIKEFVGYFGFIIPIHSMQKSIISDIYVLILISAFTITFTTLNLLHNKSNKTKSTMLQTAIFDIIMIIFAIIISMNLYYKSFT